MFLATDAESVEVKAVVKNVVRADIPLLFNNPFQRVPYLNWTPPPNSEAIYHTILAANPAHTSTH